MKISPKILHIPPYISTNWENIRSLFLKDNVLIILLKEGPQINIPDLDPRVIEIIFAAHAEFLEEQGRQKEQSRVLQQHTQRDPLQQTASFQFAFGNLDSLNSALQHNPAQANMPALPEEILSKISAIAKIVAPEEIKNIPLPEQNCNCMHCQIARAIHQQAGTPLPDSKGSREGSQEEQVSEEDLKFQDWEIKATGEKLYSVVSKLNPQEKYLVYLGEPFGCTCGVPNCEHIIAVLRS